MTAGEVATGGGTFTITTLRSVGCGAAGAETEELCCAASALNVSQPSFNSSRCTASRVR
jgi:hypothetical protein